MLDVPEQVLHGCSMAVAFNIPAINGNDTILKNYCILTDFQQFMTSVMKCHTEYTSKVMQILQAVQNFQNICQYQSQN